MGRYLARAKAAAGLEAAAVAVYLLPSPEYHSQASSPTVYMYGVRKSAVLRGGCVLSCVYAASSGSKDESGMRLLETKQKLLKAVQCRNGMQLLAPLRGLKMPLLAVSRPPFFPICSMHFAAQVRHA